MRTYPLDIDPGQVVRWIIVEHGAAPSRFRIAARRMSEVRDIPARKELHLGDEEHEDLSEVDTIATLEIAPAHASAGWLLTVEVEDEAGPRLPEKAPLVEEEGPIDLGMFYDEFIRSGRGIANVVAAVDDDAAEVRLNELVSSIERNRHGPSLTDGSSNEEHMLESLAVEDVKRISELAKAARDVRDEILRPVRAQDLGLPKPARGMHDTAAPLGLDPVPFDHPARKVLREAIDALPTPARRELLALVWIGQGDYAAAQLDKAVADTASITDLSGDWFTSEADLHELLTKSLYELKLT
jgi:hypothetical protein